jgi:hypothetical protein
MKRALGFELTDARVEWMKDQREITTAPLTPPPLFKGQGSRLFGLIANYGSLRTGLCLPLNVRSGDSIVGCDLKLAAETIRPAGKLLHYRFGAAITKDLETRMKREITRATTPQLQRQVEEAYSSEIIKFSKSCYIPSLHTAWIAEDTQQKVGGESLPLETVVRLWQSNFTPSVSNIPIAPPATPIGNRRKKKQGVQSRPHSQEKNQVPAVAEFARHWIVAKPGGLMLHAVEEKEQDDDVIRPEDMERSAIGTQQQKKCCGGEANTADLLSPEDTSLGSKVRRWFSRSSSDLSISSSASTNTTLTSGGNEKAPIMPSSSAPSLGLTSRSSRLSLPRNIDLSVLYDIIGIQQPDGGFRFGEVQSLTSKVAILSQVLGLQFSKLPRFVEGICSWSSSARFVPSLTHQSTLSFVERNLKDLWVTASMVAIIETFNNNGTDLERWELNLLKAKFWMATTLTKTPPKIPPNTLATGEFYPLHHYPHWVLFAKHTFLSTR